MNLYNPLHNIMVDKYLQIGVPPWATNNFGVGGGAWWPDHFTSELTNSI
jgi:hypothetical protein